MVGIFVEIVCFTKKATTRPHIPLINIMHKYTNDGKATGNASQPNKSVLGRIYAWVA